MFSLAVGFRTTAGNGRKLLGFEDVQSGTNATLSDRCIGIGNDGKVSFGVIEGNVGGLFKLAPTNAVVTDGAWHYVVATFDGINLVVYVDGIPVGSNQLTGGNGAKHFSGWWRLGGYKNCGFGDGFFTGNIALAQVCDFHVVLYLLTHQAKQFKRWVTDVSSVCVSHVFVFFLARGLCTMCALQVYNIALSPSQVVDNYNAFQTGVVSAACAAGFYCPAKSGSMTPCDVGCFCPQGSLVAPLPCPIGAFCGDVGLSAVVLCASGRFNPNSGSANSSACLSCPSGKFCALAGAAAPIDCPIGSYCPNSGQSSPTPCAVGAFCPSANMTVPIPCASNVNVPPGQSVCGCSQGYFLNMSGCLPCPVGFYSNSTGLGNFSQTCLPCPLGAYCLSADVSPRICPYGTFGNTSGLSTAACSGPCALGFLCAPGIFSS